MHAPGWHKLGNVLEEWPGRDEAQVLAGHNFEVHEREFYLPEPRAIAPTLDVLTDRQRKRLGDQYMVTADGVFRTHKVEGFKVLQKHMPDEKRPAWLDDDEPWEPTHGKILHVANETYGVVQNSTGWDLIEALVGEGIQYETGLSLKDGAVCSILAYLDEPIAVPGDVDPETGDPNRQFPFVNVSWTHDGSGAIKCRPTTIRVVCMNTQSAAEAQGIKNKNEYTFRHSSKVLDRIEEAKATMKGIRQSTEDVREFYEDLARVKVTKAQREEFPVHFIKMPNPNEITDTVKGNIIEARELVMSVYNSRTMPEAHRFTAYGMWLAGTEYLDHMRPYRNRTTLYNRQLMGDEKMKRELYKAIKEVVKA